MNPQDLHPDGVRLLAAKVISQCIAEADKRPGAIVVAVEWATWCGIDPDLAAEGIAERVKSGDAATLRKVDLDNPHPGADTRYAWNYRDGNRCPHPGCGKRIVNGARTCNHHRWYK